MRTLFVTDSGSQYVIENNRLTRMSEIPIIEASTNMPTDKFPVGNEILWEDSPPTVGSRYLCTLNIGPLTTTRVKEVRNEQ